MVKKRGGVEGIAKFDGFPGATIPFLRRLESNNNRNWFQENKMHYESTVREPALAFIDTMAPELAKLSPHFRALPKKVGGSLMRVYRDTRFSKDKTPYKTNIGIQFRHVQGKDVHAPGFYLHIEREECFLGVGIWRPESKVLNQIREFIVDNPAAWKKAKAHGPFKKNFELVGDALKRPPRGFPPDHELVEDLKRKDFIALKHFASQEIHSSQFPELVTKGFKQAEPLMLYLCTALEVPY